MKEQYLKKKVSELTAYELKEIIQEAIKSAIKCSPLSAAMLTPAIGNFLKKIETKDNDILC